MSLTGDVVENWKEFESAWDDYIIATQLNTKLKKDDDTDDPIGMAMVAATLCAVMGQACKRVLTNLPTLTPADRKKPDKIMQALREYFIPQRNVLYERFVFNTAKQKPGEPIDVFSMRLRRLAESCEFGQLQDELIRDRIVIGTTDETGRERLLRERPVPNLNKVIENLRAAEMSRSQREAMSGVAKEMPVEHLKKMRKGQGRTQKPTSVQGKKVPCKDNLSKKCNYCGQDKHPRQECPAKDAVCKKCNARVTGRLFAEVKFHPHTRSSRCLYLMIISVKLMRYQ